MKQPQLATPTPEAPKITPFPEPPPHFGRPSIRTPEIVTEICAAIRLDGISDSCAGLLAGVSTSTLSRWKQEDEEFAVRLGQARAQFELERVRAIRHACKRDGSVDWRAQAWLLQKSSPETYGPPPRRRKARPAAEEEESPANGQPVVTPREMELLQAARARSLANIAEEHKAIRAAVAAGAFGQNCAKFPESPAPSAEAPSVPAASGDHQPNLPESPLTPRQIAESKRAEFAAAQRAEEQAEADRRLLDYIMNDLPDLHPPAQDHGDYGIPGMWAGC